VTAILSIHSSVAYGHVGNAAAVFPLQRLGFEVWPVDTAHLSNHPAHPSWRGAVAEPARVAELLDGLHALGVLGGCAGVLTGYLGEAATGEAAARMIDRVRAANPAARYVCDPVMGDDAKGLYVRDGIPAVMGDLLVPRADIVTPNRFELGVLAEREIGDLDDALAACETLRARGPEAVIVTSATGAGAGETATLAVDGEGAWLLTTPRLHTAVHGAGDLFAALVLAHLLRGEPLPGLLSHAGSALHAVLAVTAEAGADEMLLVEAQDAFVAPPITFTAERVR
jgi:pyridoxine kinase